MHKVFFLVGFLILTFAFAQSDEAMLRSLSVYSNTGLETRPGEPVAVIVADLKSEAAALGLTQSTIEKAVETILAREGIATSEDAANLLYVAVTILDNVFGVEMSYYRPVYFFAGESSYTKLASSWNMGGLGTHDGNANFVIRRIADLTYRFVADYYASNP